MIGPYDYLGRTVYIPRKESDFRYAKPDDAPKTGPWVQEAVITEVRIRHCLHRKMDGNYIETTVKFKLEGSYSSKTWGSYSAWVSDTTWGRTYFFSENQAWEKARKAYHGKSESE